MAKYAQIFWAQPTDADVAARNKAVDTMRALISGLSTLEAIKVAGAIADSLTGVEFPDHLAAKVQTAIGDQSPAFVLKSSQMQGTVCLAVAALASACERPVKRTGWSSIDAVAAALWSALTFQDQAENPKLEELRQELIKACRDRIGVVAKEARSRHEVPDVGTLIIPEDGAAGTRANTAYRKATAPVVAALKINQELDREEIDFLWWIVSDYSEILRCPLDAMEPVPRSVTAGIEGAKMLRRLPSDGHRFAVLRHIGASDKLSLAGLIVAVGLDREALGLEFTENWPAAIPTVFPLLSALVVTGEIRSPAVTLDAREWGARALLEASIVAMEGRFGGNS